MALMHKKPNRILRALLRAPIWLYRWNLGWMMGGRFLLLTHIGRKSGLKHQTVIEVVSHNETTGAYYVAAAWREKSDLYRNIQQNPTVGGQVRNHKFQANAKQSRRRKLKSGCGTMPKISDGLRRTCYGHAWRAPATGQRGLS